ncbi:MAG: FtsH protease activity modulator HflK [Spirochaetales bacterium]
MSNEMKVPRKFSFSVTPMRIALVIIAAIVLAGAATSFFMVDQTEEGVVLRFGRYDRTVGPGLQTKLPFGIETHETVAVQRVQTATFGFRTETPGSSGQRTEYEERDIPEESVMLTGDLNIVDVEWIIQYRIDDPRAWLFNVQDREKTIRDISQSVINQLVGDRSIFAVLGRGRGRIEQEGLDQMNEVLQGYELGIRVTQVRLQNIVPPSGRVQDAFEDVNRAVQDMNRLINEGREEYNRQIPRVRGQAERLIEEARGYQARRVNEAEGSASRFTSVLEAYDEAPRITRNRLYIETIEQILSNDSEVTLIDRNLQNMLPLFDITEGNSLPGDNGEDR